MSTLPDIAGNGDNLPAVPDDWGGLAAEFDDGTGALRQHFGASMPRLRTDFGRNGKGFIDDLTGEVRHELRIVMLGTRLSRAWWEKSLDEGGGGPPDCYSHHEILLRPEPESPKLQSETCDTCPHSEWSEDEYGDRRPPACAESTNVFAWDLDEARYVWLRFQRTALKPFNRYVSSLSSRRLPLYAVATHVTLEETKRDRLEWLVPRFAVAEKLRPADVREHLDIAKEVMKQWEDVAMEMASAEPGGDAAQGQTYGPGEEPF